MQVVPVPWPCPQCTFVNPPGRTACEMCDFRLAVPEEQLCHVRLNLDPATTYIGHGNRIMRNAARKIFRPGHRIDNPEIRPRGNSQTTASRSASRPPDRFLSENLVGLSRSHPDCTELQIPAAPLDFICRKPFLKAHAYLVLFCGADLRLRAPYPSIVDTPRLPLEQHKRDAYGQAYPLASA